MKALALTLLKSRIFRAALKDIVLEILEFLAKESSNDLDDKIVARVREALNPRDDEHEGGV